MNEILKKFWFVILIGALFFGAFSYVIYEENKDKIPGKTIDGEEVILTIGGQSYTADDLFNDISSMGNEVTFDLINYDIQTSILNQSMKVTSEMKNEAEELIDTYIIAYFQQSYGDQYQLYLESWMKGYGFEEEADIIEYTLPWLVIRPQLIRDYFEANIDQYWEDFFTNENPRFISHILITTIDPENPNETELEAIAAVEAALETKDFGTVAKELSHDTGSAINEGSIGLVTETNKSMYVPEFAEASMLLADGEVSNWVQTDYGWHLIKNTGSSQDYLLQQDAVLDEIANQHPELSDKIVYEKGLELGFDFFGNTELENQFKEAMGVTE